MATVLLISISVAATGAAYTFITGAQEDAAENFEDDLRQQEQRQKSDINIEYVYKSTGDFTFMTLRNTGSITLPVEKDGQRYISLYSRGRPVTSSAGNSGTGWKYTGSPSQPVLLDPSDTITLNTTIEFPASGNNKAFKMVGPYETADSHVCHNSGLDSC